ncbi:hypothetical protein ACSS6W_003004 [Trichoderma asperelloides]
MSATPRLRSGFQSTPYPANRRRPDYDDDESPPISKFISTAASNRAVKLPPAPESAAPRSTTGNAPVIPLTLLDAPQQRLYAFAVYILLWAWKLYDWLQVIEDGNASGWLFLKWILIDFAFIFGLPELRIPWLELSQLVVIGAFASHVVTNYMLMFNIPVLSEHHVKVSNILNNNSLIMGKQIINILPEGSAVLNPDHSPFCLSGKSQAALPIYFNATVPVEVELLRLDLETGKEEIIKISTREINKVAKLVREHNADPDATPFHWTYPVKKPGVYRLNKVLDEYKLEVQRPVRDTYVVPCPQARIQTADSSDRCIRDLSNLSLDVVGTPPLKVKYSRSINGKNHAFHFQSLQPEGFASPLISTSGLGFDNSDDVSWVKSQKVTVQLNETMATAGEWEYLVEEVYDAFGNVVKYADANEELDTPKTKWLSQRFSVKERPKIRMQGCDLRNPLRVAKGRAAKLPISFGLTGRVEDTSHKITWQFSPIDSITNSGDHGDQPLVSEPGLYTLKSVSSGSCEGEVDEPSSCLLLNPLEPHLSLRTEEIADKCAGNSVGLRVDLDLVGTPPFTVRYDIISDGHVEKQAHRVDALRSQIELVPRKAGRYKYIFRSIDDDVYTGLPLTGEDKVLEQVVKPAASAYISNREKTVSACLESEVDVDVVLAGEPPFSLEWEIIHDGKRKPARATDIKDSHFQIKTSSLTKGGDYILALSSMKISVRRQRPRGAFGLIEQKNSIMAVEDTALRLPLRLQGEGPWTVSYRNLDGPSDIITKTINGPNDYLLVRSRGTYELVDIVDKQCPGIIEPTASKFEVDWFPRPEISIVASNSIAPSKSGVFRSPTITQYANFIYTGSAPYHVEYEVRHKPAQGAASLSQRRFDAALSKAAVAMDTSKAGDYTYKFSELADNLYNSDKHFTPLVVQQRVNAKPTAAFTKPGSTFKYCLEEQEQEDVIPITLTGVPPFYVEVEIKHQVGSTPETYRIPAIQTNNFGMSIPRQHLRLGNQQLLLRTVRDARGCQRKYDVGGPSIQIQLYDAPSIYPLESRKDYCIGERIAYTLSGTPPFDIAYDFNGQWNAKSTTTSFRRIAEKPGEFTITSISDKASECRAAVNIPVTIHPLPSVQISRGKNSRVDIHEGNEVDILFEFWGTPPFEFTYTRSSNAKKGQRSVILETRHDISYEHSKVVKASQEGTYEVVAIKDKFCSFSTQQVDHKKAR